MNRCPHRLAGMWLLLLATALPGQSPAPVIPNSFTITYLANEGLLLSAGGRQVLIDGLFREGVFGYATLPDSVRESLETAQPPFDAINPVLVTHLHRDHFHPAAVVRHLQHHRQTQFVAGPEVVDLAVKHSGGDPAVLSRLPDWQTAITRRAGPVELTALRMRHGSRRNYGLHHRAFLFELGGKTVLHIGDAEIVPPSHIFADRSHQIAAPSHL